MCRRHNTRLLVRSFCKMNTVLFLFSTLYTFLQVSKPVTRQEGTTERGRVQQCCACRRHPDFWVSFMSSMSAHNLLVGAETHPSSPRRNAALWPLSMSKCTPQLRCRSDSRASMASPAQVEKAVDMAAALGQNEGNLALMWHLLYDPQWQVCGRCWCTVCAALRSAVCVVRFQRADLPARLPLLRCSCRQRTSRH